MDDPYARKPWLKHYDDHVPHTLQYATQTYPELFREAAAQASSRIAVYYMGNGMTYRELDQFSNRFAHFLKRCGLNPGDTVGVHLPNIPAYYIAIMGIQKAGCVLTGVSPLLQANELEYQLIDSGARLLVTLDALFDRVRAVVPQTGVQTVAVAGIADFLSPLKAFLGKMLKKIPTGEVHPIPGIKVESLMSLLQNMPPDHLEVNLHPDIDMAAAIGLPDPGRPGSEIVATAIVLKPGVEKCAETSDKIIQYMRENVAPYKVPKKIEFMDELPLSAVGKVLKRELREMMKS